MVTSDISEPNQMVTSEVNEPIMLMNQQIWNSYFKELRICFVLKYQLRSYYFLFKRFQESRWRNVFFKLFSLKNVSLLSIVDFY